MPGASGATQPVEVLNANCVPGSVDGEDGVLLWHPDGPVLIAANIVGRMPWSDAVEQQRDARAAGRAEA